MNSWAKKLVFLGLMAGAFSANAQAQTALTTTTTTSSSGGSDVLAGGAGADTYTVTAPVTATGTYTAPTTGTEATKGSDVLAGGAGSDTYRAPTTATETNRNPTVTKNVYSYSTNNSVEGPSITIKGGATEATGPVSPGSLLIAGSDGKLYKLGGDSDGCPNATIQDQIAAYECVFKLDPNAPAALSTSLQRLSSGLR